MHSTNSDGKKTVDDAVGWYRDHGYDFIALTDHRVLSDTTAMRTDTFLTIPGMEMHGPDAVTGEKYHIVGLGISSFERCDENWSREEAIGRVNADGGLAFMGHPYWLGQSAEHLRGLHGFAGIEVFNSVCDTKINKGFSNEVWDAYLLNQGQTWGFATDDAHWKYNEEGRGWIMVRTDDFSIPGLLSAMRRGHFYASMGPTFEDVRLIEGGIRVRCSPVRRISLMCARSRGDSYLAEGDTLTNVDHQFKKADLKYVRVEIEDTNGRRAWTNPWMLPPPPGSA